MSPRLSSFAALLNAILLGAGLAILAGMIWVTGVECLKKTFWAEPTTITSDTFAGETVDFLRDGTPVIRGSIRRSEVSGTVAYRDLEGNEVTSDGKETLRGCVLNSDWGLGQWEVQWRDRVLAYSDQRNVPTYWYFVHDGHKQGHGYFVGYENYPRIDMLEGKKEANQRVGYIGLSGFRQEGVPKEEQFQISPVTWGISNRLHSRQWAANRGQYPQGYPFSVPGSILTQVYLIAEDALYHVDLRERTSQRILDLPASEILDVDFLTKSPNDVSIETYNEMNTQVLVRTAKEILFLNPQGTLQSRLTLPEPLRDAGELTICEPVGDKFYAVATERKWEGKQFHLRCHPYCFDSQGQVLWTKDVELATRVRRQDMRMESAYFWVIGAPLSVDFGFLVIAPFDGMWSGRSYLGNIQAACEDLTRSGLGNPYFLVPLLHLYTLLWAWIAWKRETSYGSSPRQKWMWTVFVYLLGLPALMGYLAHRKWPKLEECPSCKTNTPVDHDTCIVCGNEWPLPARKGVELIEA